VWATGETTWSEAVGARLGDLGWTLAAVEIGTGATLAALFGDVPWIRSIEAISADSPAAAVHHLAAGAGGAGDGAGDDVPDELVQLARHARDQAGAEVGLAVHARPRVGDTAVSVAIALPHGERRVRRAVFLTGPMGRSRAALAAAAVLLETLREADVAR